MRRFTGILLIALAPISHWVIADPTAPVKTEHPGDTALSQDSAGKFIYKSFPALKRLYVYEKDSSGQSSCNESCSSAWPPLLVSANASNSRVGDWTVIQRSDGTRQWAYMGKPVYTRFHDMAPDAGTVKEGFHPLEP